MLLTVTPLRTAISYSAQEAERARYQFARQHCLLLPQFLESGLLQKIQRRLAAGEFYDRTHEGIGEELCLKTDTTAAMLEFMANDPALFQFIQQITACDTIGRFGGRIYRMIPGTGHFDSWHSDVGQDRLIAMSVNLSTEVYRGGILQVCDAQSKEIVHEVANIGFGDAIIFRIAPNLRHRVTALEGAAAKTAYAGWFRSQPDYQSLLKQKMSLAQV
jgi:hypothetical protein